MESKDSHRYCMPVFTAVLLTKAKRWKQPECSSTEDWIGNMWSIRTVDYYQPERRMQFRYFLPEEYY